MELEKMNNFFVTIFEKAYIIHFQSLSYPTDCRIGQGISYTYTLLTERQIES